jgi:NitT/TauT family transport system substrate-binding protein
MRTAGLRVALALLALLLGACSGSAAREQGNRAAAPLTLRLGFFPNITHAPALVGLEAGIFARAVGDGVTLQPMAFNAGPAAVEALFSDALDVAYIGPNPALNAFVRSKGAAVRVIAGATSGGAALVVRPEIASVGDLRGKKLASPQLGNTQDVALRRWLQAQGLRADLAGGGDVSVVPQENAQTLTAFRAGQIAGAWVPEPWATRLVLEGGGKVLVDERDLWPGGQFVTTLLVVRTAFLRQHPDVVERLLRGHLEAIAFARANPEEAQRLVNGAIARLTGQRLSEPIVAAAWRNLTFTHDPLPANLRKAAADAAALGLLDLSTLGRDVTLDALYDLRPLNNALRAAGQPEVSLQ